MTNLLRTTALVVLSALAFPSEALGAGPEPAPAKVEEGRRHFLTGVDLYREGDFPTALVEFRKAYEIAPNWRILFNIGMACLEVHDYPCAVEALRKYKAEGGDEVPLDRKKSVETDLGRLANLVAHVKIDARPQGADVSIDDVVVGRSPLSKPVMVGAGRHRVTVSVKHEPPVSRVIEVAGGENVGVTIEVAPRTSAPRQPDAPPPSRKPVWIAGAVTVAAGTATGILGALSLDARSDLYANLSVVPPNREQVDSDREKLRTFTLATDILAATTAVAAVTTIVLYFVTSPGARPPQSAKWTTPVPTF